MLGDDNTNVLNERKNTECKCSAITKSLVEQLYYYVYGEQVLSRTSTLQMKKTH